MPLYEYVCRDCGHELEALQRLADAPLTECPACQAPALHKKVSAAGFRLAGGGWYETDFKAGGKRNLAGDNKSDSKSDSSGASGGDSKGGGSTASDSKPATKSDGKAAAKAPSAAKASSGSTNPA